MNGVISMEATPPDDKPAPDVTPDQAAQAERAKRILMLTMAFMIALPLLLFVLFHT